MGTPKPLTRQQFAEFLKGNQQAIRSFELLFLKAGQLNLHYGEGDLLVGAADDNINGIADVVLGNVLLSGGVGATPAYGKVGLTTHVTGILPIENGGTERAIFTPGSVVLGNGVSALAEFATTANRVVIGAGASGLTDDADLTWNATLNALTVNSTRILRVGTGNVFLGSGTGNTAASGTNNVALGDSALATVTTGSSNTGIGSSADVSAGAAVNRVVIGRTASGDTDNQVFLGNSSITAWVPGATSAVTLGRTDRKFAGAYIDTLTLTNPLGVASGGTGLASGTSGGILGFTGTTTLASSSALTANAIVFGGGAGATPSTPLGLGTTTTLLHGNATGAPTWAQVSLTADVTGDLPYSNLAQGSALSVLGVTGNAGADVASIAAGSDHQVLRRSGTAVTFGAINLAQSAAVTGTLPEGNGGTNQSTYAQGDLLYASAANTLAKLAIGAANTKLFINAAGTAPAWASGLKVGNFTKDMTEATGTVAYTGVGFKPSAILFFACGPTDNAISIGADDGTNKGMVSAYGTLNFTVVTTDSIYLLNAAGTTLQNARISSFDSDGFTLSWTKVGSPTGTATIIYLAIR